MKNKHTISITYIPASDILTIIPLLSTLNSKTPIELLRKRTKEMINQNYKCVGMYLGKELIGICGIWYMTRHYIGKSAELDHVIINPKLQGKGYGKMLIDWIMNEFKADGIEACELNAYIPNVRSHQFYEREDFKKYGYHFLRVLRDDGEFY